MRANRLNRSVRGPVTWIGGKSSQTRADGVYERMVGEFLQARDGGEGSGLVGIERTLGDDFTSGVAKCFHEGPARACSRAIGDWIDRRLTDGGWTQQALADRVGVDRSAVARWTAGGTLSMGHLILVMMAFEAEASDLPWPERRELMIEAFTAALDYVRSRVDPNRPSRGLDRDEFWCLYHLFAEPFWEQAVRDNDIDRLKLEATRVLAEATRSLGRPVSRVAGVDGLRRLVEDWAASWVVCLKLLPDRGGIR